MNNTHDKVSLNAIYIFAVKQFVVVLKNAAGER